MDENQTIVVEAIRKVLAKDRSILARRDDFVQKSGANIPVGAMREYRALEKAIQVSNIGEIMLAADKKSEKEQQEALNKAKEMLRENNIQEKTIMRVLDILKAGLDWDKKANDKQAELEAKPAKAQPAAEVKPPTESSAQLEREVPPVQLAQPKPAAPAVAQSSWDCICGQQGNTGRFCVECGRPMETGKCQVAAPNAHGTPAGEEASAPNADVQPNPATEAWQQQSVPAANAQVNTISAPTAPKAAADDKKKRMALVAIVVALLGVLVFFGMREFGGNSPSRYSPLSKQAAQAVKEAKTELSLGSLDLGDKKSDVEKAKLGQENETKEESGFVFHYYNDVQVATDGDEVVGLKSLTSRLATKRGIHQGDSLADVKKAYGTDYKKSAGEGGLTYYEYVFYTESGEEGYLRFAIKDNDQKVGYISARLTRYEKANESQQSAPAEASDNSNNARKAQAALNSFYNAISHKNYQSAWQLMTPEQQKRMGSYDSFCNGYSTTISSDAGGINVSSVSAGKVVLTYRLMARDRMSGGKVKVQTFDCSATMVPVGGDWKILYTEAKQVDSRVE